MQNILAISSSFRPRGNGETLLRLCEKYLKNINSEIAFKHISLKDYNIKNCTGCMACSLNREFCKLDDDLKSLIDEILNADILLLSAPVYFLGAASIVKAINDRLLYMHNLVDYSKRKPAGIILTAGRKDWEGYSIQNISTLLLSLGFKVNDFMLEYGQGPSEVLLNENLENRVKDFAQKILIDEPLTQVISDRCPICKGNSFSFIDKSTVKCPTCNIKGKIEEQDNKVLILFSEDGINNNRWSEKNLKAHMEEWVAESGQRYRLKVKEVLKKRKALLNS